MATNGLSQIADRIRKDAGFRPMHPLDEYTEETCDNDGWYDFYISLNGFAENHMDSCIEFIVQSLILAIEAVLIITALAIGALTTVGLICYWSIVALNHLTDFIICLIEEREEKNGRSNDSGKDH